MCDSILIDLIVQQFLILFALLLHDLFDVFVLVRVGFYMCGIDEKHFRLHESMADGLFQNASEDCLKQIAIPEAANVVLTQCREVGNRLTEVIADEPSIGDIGFDFFYSLTHRTYPKDTLNKRNFDKHDRINTGSSVIFTIQILNEIVDEAKVDCVFDFPYKMILRNKFVQRDERNLSPSFVACLS